MKSADIPHPAGLCYNDKNVSERCAQYAGFLGDFLAGVIEVLFVDRWVEKQYERRRKRRVRAATNARCSALRGGKEGEMHG